MGTCLAFGGQERLMGVLRNIVHFMVLDVNEFYKPETEIEQLQHDLTDKSCIRPRTVYKR